MALQIRRGTEAQRVGITLAEGELVYTTDSKKLYIGDGHTLGGYNVLQTTFPPTPGSGLVWNNATETVSFDPSALNQLTTSSVPEGTNKYYTVSRAVNDIYTALSSGTPSGITFGYNPGSNTITATVTGGGSQLPPITGNNGKYLTIINGQVTWATAPLAGVQFPSAPGNQGSYLTTDGQHLVWADIVVNALNSGTHYAQLDEATGNLILSGSLKLPAGATVYINNQDAIYNFNTDQAPSLAGSLNLNGHNIVGATGNINISQGITAGTLALTTGLGANLDLHNYNITGVGNVNITGSITLTNGTLNGNVYTTSLTASLGSNLQLNGFDVRGTGNININGSIQGVSLTSNTTITASGTIQGGSLYSPGSITGQNVSAVSTVSAPVLSAITNVQTASIVAPSEQYNIDAHLVTDGSTAKTFNALVSRGTPSSPTAISAGDVLGGFTVQGYAGNGILAGGNSYGLAAGITVQLDATADTTKLLPRSNLLFILGSNSDSNFNPAASLDYAGNFKAATIITGSYNGQSNYPTHGVTAGMILFNSSDKHFYGYDGTTWKQLDN